MADDTPIEWVREHQWFAGWFATRLNRHLLLHLGPLVEEYDRSFAGTEDPKTSWRIRRDLAAVMAWGARARFADEVFDGALQALLSGVNFFALIVAPTLLVSAGPPWLNVVLVCGAAVLAIHTAPSAARFGPPAILAGWNRLPETLRALGERRGLTPDHNRDRPAPAKIVGWLSSIVVLAGVVALVWAWPAPPHGALSATGIGALTALTIPLVALIWQLVTRVNTLRASMIALTVVVLAGCGQWWQLGKADHAAWWYPPEFGALLGTVIGALATVLNLGFQLFNAAQTFTLFRRYAEAEFVQSAIRALYAASPPTANRVEIVRRVEYLAVVLERGVAGELRREDPASAADIASTIGARAAALRAHKRDVLFGKPGAMDELRTALHAAVIAGADQEWAKLNADPAWTSTGRPGRLARAARVGGRVLIFVVPFAIGAAVWLISAVPINSWLPAAVPFAIAWVTVNLAELLAPGSGKGVGDLAANTDAVAKPFGNLFSRSG